MDMAAVRGRYKRNRHILSEPLSEVEVQTLFDGFGTKFSFSYE